MMPRYIDADELKEWVKNWLYKDRYYHNGRVSRTILVTELYDILEQMPTANVVERKSGKWIWMGEKGDSRFMCSVCKSKENVPTCNGEPTIWWYCPNCGADMRKERG